MAPGSALRKRYGYARSRAAYIDQIQFVLTGAIKEFYKGALASRLRLGLAAHWATEASRLVHGELIRAVEIPTRGVARRGDAFMRAVVEVQAEDARYRARAEYEVRRDYKLPKLRVSIDDRDTGAFWTMVHGAVANSLDKEDLT